MLPKYRLEDAERLKAQLGEDARHVDTARRWAINAVTRKAATFISRDIRADFAIRASDIKAQLSIQKYGDNAGRALLYTGGKIPLEKFGGKDKRVVVTATSKRGKKFKTSRRAATARVRKRKGRQTVPGGFMAKGRIFRRREQDRNNSELVPMFGPSIPGLVAYPSTIQGAQDLVRDQLNQEFSDRLDYLLTR